MAAMNIAMSGSSGLIGTALRTSLEADGHTVLRLVSRPVAAADEVRLEPRVALDPAVLSGVDAVVNLAGANVGGHRWTAAYKRVVYDSRLETTRTLVKALQSAHPRPRVFVSASAIGYYGDRGDDRLTESAPAGGDFLAHVCRDWEAATGPAIAASVRVVLLRTGLVLDRAGGAFAPLLRLFNLGLGGQLGSGRQYWSTLTLTDEIRAIRHLIDHDTAAGAFNLSGPEPVTNAAFTRSLGGHLRRPTLLHVPPFALQIALGEFSSGVLGSQRVIPEKLLATGFHFEAPDVDSQLRTLVGR